MSPAATTQCQQDKGEGWRLEKPLWSLRSQCVYARETSKKKVCGKATGEQTEPKFHKDKRQQVGKVFAKCTLVYDSGT